MLPFGKKSSLMNMTDVEPETAKPALTELVSEWIYPNE
jgi:hypothetical protein